MITLEMERKKERQTPEAMKKLPQVGFEPTTLHSRQMLLPRQPSWQGPNQTSHTPV